MREEFYIISGDDSQQLHCMAWAADQKPVAVLQLVHGMEEYIARYEPLAKAMVDRGWAVIGHDHLGHGQSGRWERGFFTERAEGAAILIEDIERVNRWARDRWQGVPVFVFGHSMGSFFVRRFLALYPDCSEGTVICGSGWYNVLETGIAYWAARVIGGLKGWHSRSRLLTAVCSLPFLFAFRKEGKYAWLSKNKANVATYEADPLCGFGFTCGGYLHMYRNLMLVSRHDQYSRLNPKPLLVISGADDPVGGRKAVPKIVADYRCWGYLDVTGHIVPDNRHEILFEREAADTIRFIADWLDRRRGMN